MQTGRTMTPFAGKLPAVLSHMAAWQNRRSRILILKAVTKQLVNSAGLLIQLEQRASHHIKTHIKQNDESRGVRADQVPGVPRRGLLLFISRKNRSFVDQTRIGASA